MRIVGRVSVGLCGVCGELVTTTHTVARNVMIYLLRLKLYGAVSKLERSIVCFVLWFRYPAAILQEFLELRLGQVHLRRKLQISEH
jgi:hypothetical protein